MRHHTNALYCYYRIVILLIVSFSASAQRQSLKFEGLDTDEGLSQSNVRCILQDSRGFMWFGTNRGLNKYDGYKFTVYFADNKNDITDSPINAITEDSLGNIWLATRGDGLRMFDREKDKIIKFTRDGKNNLLNSMCIDSQGNFWMGTDKTGLCLFNRKNKHYTYYVHQPGNPKSISDNFVTTIFEDSQHNLWVGTQDGLNLMDRTNGTFINFKHDEKNPRSFNQKNIECIFEDSKNQLWIGGGDGLTLMTDKTNGEFKQFQKEIDPNSLPHNHVMAINEDLKGYLWIGTQNGGLSLLNPARTTFYNYAQDVSDQTSLNDNSIYSIGRDKKDNMWLGTFSHGIDFVSVDANKFTLYKSNSNKNSLSNNSVLTFCEDSKGNFWIGTDGGGINLFNRKEGTFTHYKHEEGNDKSICGNFVLKIIEDHAGNLWIGTWAEGVTVFNKEKNSFKHFKNDPNDPTSLSSSSVISIFEDSEENIWIGTITDGVNLYNPKKNNFLHYNTLLNHPEGFHGLNINSIYEDSKKNLWIGSEERSICLLNKKTKIFSIFEDGDSVRAVNSRSVLSIYEDSYKNLWWGTRSGLDQYDIKTKRFIAYHVKQGLPGEEVPGILEDAHGNLWLGTSNGISQFNIKNKSFKNFTIADGLQGKEFSRNAFYKSRSGAMYFGGPNGFNEFFPDNIKDMVYDPPLVFTDFQIFNKPVKISENSKEVFLKKHISETKDIKLSYKESVISFEFASLNYTSPYKKQYAYFMEGFDKDWNYTGTQHGATYTNLNAGNYVFKVRGLDNQGNWSAKTLSLSITIVPPYWQTWWFRALILSFTVGCFAAVFWIRISIVKNQKQALEFQVAKRTEELALLTDVERGARQQAEKAKLEAEQANQAKSVFLATMSHEIRTPMNGVIGMASLLSETSQTSEQAEYTEIIKNCGDSLLTVINDILDFSKIESGKMELEYKDFDLRTCIEEVLDVFAQKAAQIGLDLIYEIDYNVPTQIIGDSVRLKQIILNLVSNAIKFTHQGEIFVGIHLIGTKENKVELGFEIRDTGIGIPEDKIDRLFKAFSQVDSSTTRKYGGTGLGLVICEKLIGLMSGQILVESTSGQGTTFTFTIQAALSQQPTRTYVHHNIAGMEGKKILVVDDNLTNRNILKNQLEQWKLIPTLAVSGLEALEILFGNADFDLVLSDMQMPVMDGIELATHIRKKHLDLPIILLSSVGDDKTPVHEELFASVLTKPVRQAALFKHIVAQLSPQQAKVTVEILGKKKLSSDFAKHYPQRILITEDNLINQKLAERVLHKLGYAPDKALNGQEALKALDEQQYDIILMDVQMPVMDGLETTKRIRLRNDVQPIIIAMTANAMQGDREMCLEAGMDDYISKPVKLEDLVIILEKWSRG